jgi:hypothetical protein
MLAKRIAVPLPVPAAGSAAAVGVLHADAAESAGCSVTYSVVDQWGSGFTGDVKIRNTGGVKVDGWKLEFAFPSGQTLSEGWNGTWTPSGTVTDAGWNRGTLEPEPGRLLERPGGTGRLGKTEHLSGVQTGTEIFTGSGRLDTTAHSVSG